MHSKITISGRICTGKSSVFSALQSRLHWPLFSSGTYFRSFAKEHKLNLNNAEEQTAKLTLQVDGMVADMLKKPGNLIVEAWLGGILAGTNNTVLKVLLTADDKIRFQRFAQREGVSLPAAQQEVLMRDASWLAKVKQIHKRTDIFDPINYDLVIDTSNVSIEYVVSQIINSLS